MCVRDLPVDVNLNIGRMYTRRSMRATEKKCHSEVSFSMWVTVHSHGPGSLHICFWSGRRNRNGQRGTENSWENSGGSHRSRYDSPRDVRDTDKEIVIRIIERWPIFYPRTISIRPLWVKCSIVMIIFV